MSSTYGYPKPSFLPIPTVFGSKAIDLADTSQNGDRSGPLALPPHTRSQHNNSQVFGPFLILSSNVRSPFRSKAAGPHMSNFELGSGLSVKFQLCRVPVKKRRCLGPLLSPPVWIEFPTNFYTPPQDTKSLSERYGSRRPSAHVRLKG